MSEPFDHMSAGAWAVESWTLGDRERSLVAAVTEAAHRLERLERAAIARLRRLAAAADTLVDRHVPRANQDKAVHALLVAAAVLTVVGVAATTVVTPAPRSSVPAHVAGAVITRADPVDAAAAPAAAVADTVPPVAPPVTAAAPAASPPALRGALPIGKGMWLYVPEKVEGGDVGATVAKAKAVGITHLYVRTGSSRMGFYAQDYLNRLLPAAHAGGIRVYGWDFPYFTNVADDVARSLAAINYTTPDGHRIDGFAADIELRSMGVNINEGTAWGYGEGLRRGVGDKYPLIAVVPRPSPALVSYPFAHVVKFFDAVAPMVYWMNREPGADVAGAFRDLAVHGKPIMPVGQAYDGFAEGGKPGVPPKAELQRFMEVADQHGAPSVSFWSWQHADTQAWEAIRDAGQFVLPAEPAVLTAPQLTAYQFLLTSLGFPAPQSGVWDVPTVEAVGAYQRAANLPVTGHFDQPTRAMLFTPFAPPIHPAA